MAREMQARAEAHHRAAQQTQQRQVFRFMAAWAARAASLGRSKDRLEEACRKRALSRALGAWRDHMQQLRNARRDADILRQG